MSPLEARAWREGWRHGFAGRPARPAAGPNYAGGYEAGQADRTEGRVRLVVRLAYPPE